MTVSFAARWLVKAVTPPIVLLALKWLLIALGLRKRAGAPETVAPAAEPAASKPPEWEYVPEGWERQRRDPSVKGWDVQAVADAYRAKWPSYVAALAGTRPLGVYHEVPAGEAVAGEDASAHNMLVSYAYVLALTARRKQRVSLLDWGGGPGHYLALSRAVLPDVEIDYSSRDVPALTAYGRELFPEATFYDDDSCLERRYDLVLASGSLQYSEDWPRTLAGLGRAAGEYLYVTRLPVARAAPSFVVLQRAYDYGYETEYVGWVLNRDELLRAAASAGLELVREFLLEARFSAAGAPEDPVGHRGFLFRPARAGET